MKVELQPRIIGYSDADYVPLITCAACKNKEQGK